MVTNREGVVDIESNRNEYQEGRRNEQVTRSKGVNNMLRSLGLTKSFGGLDDDQNSGDSDSSRNSLDGEYNDIESLINDKYEGEKKENMPLVGKTHLKDKQKVKNSKKGHASKPPRPRRGPSLSTSDLRLVKEISEMVMKKRARIERLKSLKKVRSARTQSAAGAAATTTSTMSLFAMMITVLFLIVIILQGFGSSTTGLVAGQFDSKLPK